MHLDEIKKQVKVIKSRALNYEWAQVQRMLINLDKKLSETPADIREEKGGYWL